MVGRLSRLTSPSDVWFEIWGDDRGLILLFVSLGWFLTLGLRIVYPALLPQITSEFAVGYSVSGILVSILWLAYALLQFPGGLVADWLNERIVLVLSVTLTVVAVIAIIWSATLLLFVLATIILGIGTGFYGTSRVTVLSAIYTERDTTAISICQAAGNFGNMILPMTAGFISVYAGWRWGFGAVLPFLTLTAIGLWLFIPKRTSSNEETESLAVTLKKVAGEITNTRVVVVTGVLFLTMFIYQSVTGFLPTYLAEIKGVSASTAAIMFGLFFASAIGVQFISGLISDRYNRRLAIGVFMGLSVPAFVALTLVEGFLVLWGVVILLSCVLGGFPPAHAYAVRALPSEIQGSGYGLLRTLYIAFGALGPLSIGILADSGLFNEGFLALGGVALFTSAISLLLPSIN